MTSPPPIDLAVCMLSDLQPQERRSIVSEESFNSKMEPVHGEAMFLLGYPGSTAFRFDPITRDKRRSTVYGYLNTPGVPLLTQMLMEPLRESLVDPRFHAAVHFPAQAPQEAGGPDVGLPNPGGLSGSFLWDTKYVASLGTAEAWTPSRARVCGLVWGADDQAIYVTKVEHFLAEAKGIIEALDRR